MSFSAVLPFTGSALGSIRARRTAPSRRKVEVQSLFDFFSPPKSGFREKQLFKPQEKVAIGPLRVSPMGFGTWSWGNQFLWGYKEEMDTELQEVFNLVVSSGISFFDTADSYGTGRLNGQSEKLLGRFLTEYPGSERVKGDVCIATKLAAYPWRLTTGQFVSACRASLDRVGLQKMGLAQLHWSTANYAPPQERVLWDSLVALYNEGLAEAVGVSNYGPQQLLRIYDYLDRKGVPLAAVQVQYSLLSCGPVQQSTKHLCDELGITLIAYSPLALGMLTGKYSAEVVPAGPRGALFKQILPGTTPLLNTINGIAHKRRKSASQVSINWCMCKGTLPIPGAKSLAQAQDNLGALGWRLSSAQVAALDDAAGLVPKGMLQNIFQTK